MIVTSSGVGAYAAGERHVAVYDGILANTRVNRKPAVIWCHGRGADATQGYAEAYTADVARALAEDGFVYTAIDDGGPSVWAGAAALTSVAAAKTWVQANLPVLGGKVIIFGFSMGGLTALNYTVRNTGSVLGCASVCPAVDIPYLHDNNPTYATEIEANFGGAGAWLATASPNYSPYQGAVAGQYASKPPIKVWYSNNDTSAITSTQRAFLTAAGSAVQARNLGDVGHTPVTVDPVEVISFANALL